MSVLTIRNALAIFVGFTLLGCNDITSDASLTAKEPPRLNEQRPVKLGPPSLSKDFDLAMKRLDKPECMRYMRNIFSADEAVLIKVIFPSIIEDDFKPKNQKQKDFLSILSSGNQKVTMQDTPILLEVVENKACKVPYYELSHPIMRDMTQDHEEELSLVATKLRNGTATYSDVAEVYFSGIKNSEEVNVYLLKEDPNAYRGIIRNSEKILKKMSVAMNPLIRIGEKYGLE